MDGPYLTAKLGASLVSLCAREIDCVQCGVKFPPSNSRRSVCSDLCKAERSRAGDKARDKARRPRKTQRELKGSFSRRCLWCLAGFDVHRADLDRGRVSGWFCSRECSFANMRLHGHGGNSDTRTAWQKWAVQFERKSGLAKPSTACRICAKPTGSSVALSCAGQCRIRWAQVSHCITPVKCRWCGVDFNRLPGSYSRHCSDLCHGQHTAEVSRPHKRAAKAVRRARERGAEREYFDPLEVLARDRWRCQLCGVKTPKAKRGSIDDDAPELDHVVPLSKGGPHTRANTQCLCRRCNGLKSNTARGQLGLTF